MRSRTKLQNSQGSVAIMAIPFIVIVVVAVVGLYFMHITAPLRHDRATTRDLNTIRVAVGRYVVANKKMPTFEQLSLPADVRQRASERHYTLTMVADKSKNNNFFNRPSYDYKQCADFLTESGAPKSYTNDAHTGFGIHHKGTQCFLNYSYLYDSRVKP